MGRWVTGTMRTIDEAGSGAAPSAGRESAELTGASGGPAADGGAAGATGFSPSRGRGMIEVVWGATATALSVLYTAVFGLMAASAAMLGRPHAVSRITRLWARFILITCGVKVTIRGMEHLAAAGSCVMVSNHQSFFDIFAICALLPGEPRFVAKQELGKIPVIGYTMRHGGHIMIDRAQGGQAIRRAVKIARAGYSIVVFAEGTRFSDNRVHPFNDGAAWLAIASGQKCVPMAVSGTAGFFPRGARVVRPGRRMRIDIGAPIDTAGMRSADREPLTRELEARVRALFRAEV